MKHLDEYRDARVVAAQAQAIRRLVTRPWTLMEVCGGQTHSILRNGLEALLPPEVTLVHGPGCPVCVTDASLIDAAIELAVHHGVVLASFGDMLRVPGATGSLLEARAQGADVRMVYSPLDAVSLARRLRGREVVFFAVGFETTAPANAAALLQANRWGVENFSLLVGHVRVPPAIEAILSAPGCRVQAFLAPGHVCSVQGTAEYEELAARFHRPIVVTGFEPTDILEGIRLALAQLECGRARVENPYGRAVAREGNPAARDMVHQVFAIVDRPWRGVGLIRCGGLALREPWRRFDALARFGLAAASREKEDGRCQAGLVLQGLRKPSECPAFATHCTPEHPLGAPMVSSEGACAAYYLYGRRRISVPAAAGSGS